jgi:hypothetical protein
MAFAFSKTIVSRIIIFGIVQHADNVYSEMDALL